MYPLLEEWKSEKGMDRNRRKEEQNEEWRTRQEEDKNEEMNTAREMPGKREVWIKLVISEASLE